MKMNLLKHKTIFTITVCLYMIVASCKRETEVISNKENEISFFASHIMEEENGDISKSASINNSSDYTNVVGNQGVSEIIDYDNDQDFIIEGTSLSVNNAPAINDNQGENNAKIQNGKFAATTPVANGIKYRLLIYRINNGQEVFVESPEITTSTTRYKTILYAGVTYKYYAYSYNQTSSVPLPSNTNNPQIPNKSDAPLLVATGQFTVGTSDNNIRLVFQHKTSKMQIKVDTRGIFANNITALDLTIVRATSTVRNYNLRTGAYDSNVLSTNNFTNVPATFVNDGSPSVRLSTNAMYTSEAAPTINTRINNLTVTVSSSSRNLINPTAPANANFTTFPNNVGTIKQALISVKNTEAVLPPGSWAGGNLYYDAAETDPRFKYKFGRSETAATVHNCNYYFNWNTLLPRSEAQTTSEVTAYGTGDPCRLVYPAGTWRTPSYTDFYSLIGGASPTIYPARGSVSYRGSDGTTIYFWEAGTATGTSLNNRCNIGNTDDGQYWASTERSSGRGHILEIDGDNMSVNNLKDRNKSQGRNIRCVKN